MCKLLIMLIKGILLCNTLFIVLPQQECVLQLSLGVGIPVTFLLTAIISSLLTLLITYQCLTRRRSSQAMCVQELVYDSVSINESRASIETSSNLALPYGTVAQSTSYQTLPE